MEAPARGVPYIAPYTEVVPLTLPTVTDVVPHTDVVVEPEEEVLAADAFSAMAAADGGDSGGIAGGDTDPHAPRTTNYVYRPYVRSKKNSKIGMRRFGEFPTLGLAEGASARQAVGLVERKER